MDQLHRRFTTQQVKVLLQGYCQGMLGRQEIQAMLGIAKTRFFALLKQYRQDPGALTIPYQRATRPRLPISGCNYSALRDRLKKKGIDVSVTTIIRRARRLGCYKPRRKRKAHDREVVTASIGALLQHDASTHLWSPFAQEKWALVTTIDDFSRKLLFADFFRKETTWAHVQAVQAIMQSCGIPLRYYVYSLRVFRFVQGRDSFWRKSQMRQSRHVLQTDDTDTDLSFASDGFGEMPP